MEKTLRRIRRIFIAVIGFTVLWVGLAMMGLPGPEIGLIPLGLAVLATEFLWGEKPVEKRKRQMEQTQGTSGKGGGGKTPFESGHEYSSKFPGHSQMAFGHCPHRRIR